MHFLWFAACVFVLTEASRHLRHIPSVKRSPSCEDVCEAQWKTDFRQTFHKFHELGFYDLPLDEVITASKHSLAQFCSISQQKHNCFQRECGIKNIAWTTDRHVCIDHLDNFRDSMPCLKATRSVVHGTCSTTCQKVKSPLSPSESLFLSQSRRRSARGIADEYREQNEHCAFIACHHICHKEAVDRICTVDERDAAKKLIDEYYQAHLSHDVQQLRGQGHDHLFSSLCRRLTPGEDENQFVENQTRYNGKLLEHISADVTTALDHM